MARLTPLICFPTGKFGSSTLSIFAVPVTAVQWAPNVWSTNGPLEGLQESEQVGHMGTAYVPMGCFHLPSCRWSSGVEGTTRQNLTCHYPLHTNPHLCWRKWWEPWLQLSWSDSTMNLQHTAWPETNFSWSVVQFGICYIYKTVYETSCCDCVQYPIEEHFP